MSGHPIPPTLSLIQKKKIELTIFSEFKKFILVFCKIFFGFKNFSKVSLNFLQAEKFFLNFPLIFFLLKKFSEFFLKFLLSSKFFQVFYKFINFSGNFFLNFLEFGKTFEIFFNILWTRKF